MVQRSGDRLVISLPDGQRPCRVWWGLMLVRGEGRGGGLAGLMLVGGSGGRLVKLGQGSQLGRRSRKLEKAAKSLLSDT